MKNNKEKAPAVYDPPTAGVLELAVEEGFAQTTKQGTFNADPFINGNEV